MSLLDPPMLFLYAMYLLTAIVWCVAAYLGLRIVRFAYRYITFEDNGETTRER